MAVDVARFQSNDKPWSDDVLPLDWEKEWTRRLRFIKGPYHVKRVNEPPGPARTRPEAVDIVVREMMAAGEKFQIAVWNDDDASKAKVVRARTLSKDNPFGPVYHTTGPCRDDYPNIIKFQNRAGQLMKLQEPAAEAYLQAEAMNGKAITGTGYPFIGWRSCEVQTDLYRSDPGRFANPDDSRHCRGLAVDVTNTPTNLTSRARSCLIEVGFCFGVSGEPWHAAFQECG